MQTDLSGKAGGLVTLGCFLVRLAVGEWLDFAAVAPLPRGWVHSPACGEAFSWQRPCSVKTGTASSIKKDVLLYLIELFISLV